MKKFAFAFGCLALATSLSVGALASAIPPQVTLSQGSMGGVVFTGSNGGTTFSLTGTVAQCGHANCSAGNAILDPLGVTGKYWMWLTGGPVFLSDMGGGNFDASMGSATLWINVKLGPNGDGSLGSLMASIVLTDLHGGMGNTPQLDGLFTASSSTVDFASTFATGIPGSLDFTVKLPANKTLGLSNGSSVYGFVSSGELVPSVPEPGTLALMGTSMLSLAGFVRRYRVK